MSLLRERFAHSSYVSKAKEYLPKIKRAGYKGFIDAAAAHIVTRQDALASMPRSATTFTGVVFEEITRELEVLNQNKTMIAGIGVRSAVQELFRPAPEQDQAADHFSSPFYIPKDIMESEIQPTA